VSLVRITDPSDPRLADYAALTDAELRKAYEHERGVLVAEGPNPVRELARSRFPVRSLLVAEERVAELQDVTEQLDASVPVYVVTREVLYAVVRFQLHQGVLGCGGRLASVSPSEVATGAHRVVLLEGLGDHENLGTLFRSIRGLGGDAVLLGPGCADPLYRRCVRVSMGHVLHVPFARVASIVAALDLLHDAGFTTVALTPAADAVDLRDVEVAATDRVALLLGAEGPGLSGAALAGADVRARITMHAGVDSLNVAAAGAIALHALTRGPVG
jgi:tRNA G18 (ribose-2'-O)-methylase SpoU